MARGREVAVEHRSNAGAMPTITSSVISGNGDGRIAINSGQYSGTLDSTSNFGATEMARRMVK
jgi:hypothetical protein